MPDHDAAIPQSAALPYRRKGSELEVLLVTSLTSRRWVLPKGHIDPPLSPRQAAEKEAFEEAGVGGRLSAESIGVYTYTKHNPRGSAAYCVQVFAMEVHTVLDTWPEEQQRNRTWMTPDAAAAAVAEPELADLIRGFAETRSA